MKHTGRCLTSLVGAAALVLAGCAGKPPPPVASPPSLNPDIASRLGTIGMAPVEALETARLGPAGDKADAAERAGGNAAGGWAYGSVAAVDIHPVMGLAMLLLLPVAIVGGGIYGAVVGVSGKEARAGGQTLGQAVADIRPDETLRERVFFNASRETRHNFVLLNDRQGEFPAQGEIQSGADSILDITDAAVALVPVEGGANPDLTLVMSARLGLRWAAGDEEFFATDLNVRKGAAGFREWVADDASLFRKVLDEALDTFAEKAVTSVFLRYSTPAPEASSKSPTPFLTVQPVIPKHGSYVKLVQPTLRWEAFPTPANIAADPYGGLARVTNVTYDLKIWRQKKFSLWPGKSNGIFDPDRIIHDIEGISGLYFVPPDPLETFTLYFWTVRARFEIDGFPRFTDWMVVKDNYYIDANHNCWDPYTIDRDPQPSCLLRFHTPLDLSGQIPHAG